MQHSISYSLSRRERRLPGFKVIAYVILVLIVVTLAVYFAFRSQIHDAVIPHLPTEGRKTFRYYVDLFHLGVFELLWTAAVVLIALYLFTNTLRLRMFYRFEYVLAENEKKARNIIILMSTVIVFLAAFVILEQFPNSSDEYVYVLQGETMSEGKLWTATHPVKGAFEFNHIANKDGKYVGRFPPGWPMFLSLAFLVGISPAFVNPVLGIITLIVFYALARKLYGVKVAVVSLIAFALTGFFIYNAASFFSHVVCALETLLFVKFLYEYRESRKFGYAVLAGFCLGLIVITRYYTAVLVFIPFFFAFFYWERWRAVRLFVGMAIGGILPMVFLFWYNYSITGHPLLPVTMWAYDDEKLGFVNDHTFIKGVEHIVRRMLMFAYWCSPVLMILYFVFLFEKVRNKAVRVTHPEDYIFLLLIIGYIFYYEIGGNQYGPRFYFEGFPFLILFVVSVIVQQRRNWARVLFYAGLLVALIRLPFISAREHAIVEERKDIYTLVEKSDLKNAVVMMEIGTSVNRPMPSGDLTRNDGEYDNDVLYAIYKDSFKDSLMNYYRDRHIYKYTRDPQAEHGTLVRLR